MDDRFLGDFPNEAHMNEDLRTLVIPPRILPRDFLDICLALPIGLVQGAILCGVPALLGYILTDSPLIAFVACCAAYGFGLLFTVGRLTVSADGLHFHRILGSPRVLPWGRISSVALTSRRELIIRGWLWPLFPSHEATPCLSAVQHFRITWDSGFCFYPPADVHLFERYVIARIEHQNADKALRAKASARGSTGL